jgi:hypothetical protein
MESLETRETPSTFHGPFGGSLTVDKSVTLATTTATVDYVGPNGGSVTSQLQLDNWTGQVSGESIYVGPQGRTATTQLSGQVADNVFGGTLTVTGIKGRTASTDVSITKTGNTYDLQFGITGPRGHHYAVRSVFTFYGHGHAVGTTQVTGPNGRTVESASLAQYNAESNTITLLGTVTGPDGRSFEWNRTFAL